MIDRSIFALLVLLLLVELEKFSWLFELAFNFVTSLLVLVFMATSLDMLVMVLVILALVILVLVILVLVILMLVILVLVILLRQEKEVIACLEVMTAAVHRKELPGESTVGAD